MSANFLTRTIRPQGYFARTPISIHLAGLVRSIRDSVRAAVIPFCGLVVLVLSGCGGGGSSGDTAQTYNLSATVSGLKSTGLALKVSSTQVVVSSDATTVMLASALPSGSAYTVTVAAQPAGETCTVNNGTGTIEAADVSKVAVSCSGNAYTIGGSITGLTTSGLVLLNNAGDVTTIAANATEFTMNTSVAYGGSYAITVKEQPTPRFCVVTNGSGGNVSGNVTDVMISCTGETVYSFGNGSTDAAGPDGELLQGSDGNFYGVTLYGGVNGKGAVFKITPAGAETVLYSFNDGPADGANPDKVRLIQDNDGNFYGTTSRGGANGKGTVFKLTPAGVETILHSFAGAPDDGDYPLAGLLQGSDGNFYGTTLNGGASGRGLVFKLTPAGVETVLYSFGPGGDAGHPAAALVEDSDGNFYGVSNSVGASNLGAVFKITPEGVETVLHSFAGAPSDGAIPYAVRLLRGSDSNFYGTTARGGANDLGTIFKLTPAGVETVLYSFTGGPADGDEPIGNLVEGSDGSLYGTTAFGGTAGTSTYATGGGTVFKLTPSGIVTVLHSFVPSVADGSEPNAGPTWGSDGNVYGTTYSGGLNNQGSFFRIVPN